MLKFFNAMKQKKFIITPGEPAGIGPDLVIKLFQKKWPVTLIVCGCPKLLYDRAIKLNLPIKFKKYDFKKNISISSPGLVNIIPISTPSPVIPGKLCVHNANYVLQTLKIAAKACLNNLVSGVITGPIHKGIINFSGIKFSGHTEFFSTYAKKMAVMMLVTPKMKVAFATTHVPLKKISEIINKKYLYQIINILNEELKNKFNISKPNIIVCGLNPHAGEDGYIGSEEIDTIIPVIKKLILENISVSGPFAADIIFQNKYLNQADLILTMYHDQGLPVVKYHSFNSAVNVTLGLPFIRTSVDHGTALDLAGTGKGNMESFINAINIAIQISK